MTAWRSMRWLPGGPRSLGAITAIALLATLGACSSDKKSIVEPDAHLPPQVEAVYPDARSVSVPYDTQAWVQFKEAMDPSTINDHTVFLKLDTRRISSTVTYDAATRRILIRPTVPLALLRTHTVEITPAVATAEHGTLGETFFWQFRTIGVRRPGNPAPPGTIEQSPFVALSWTGTDLGIGVLSYDVYVGADSAAVASHAVPPFQTSSPFYLPSQSWPLAQEFYWSVVARNQTTDEHLEGPVWRFETMEAGAPIDSIILTPDYWGYYYRTARRQLCNSGLATGPDYNCAIHYPLSRLPSDIRLAGASFLITPTTQTNLAARLPVVFDSKQNWTECVISYPGPPDIGNAGLLARGQIVRFSGTDRYLFQSDTLTAFVEAAVKQPGFYGFILGSSLNTGYQTPATSGIGLAQLKIYYYVSPPAAARESRPR
jgi:hypothetical protein